jgi:hypothetical protein
MKTIYDNFKINRVTPYREGDKICITIHFDDESIISGDLNYKINSSRTFIVDLKKIPKEVKRIDFYYKQKGYPKIKIAEYKINLRREK